MVQVVATPDTRSSVVIRKQFAYRGSDRFFTNRYHFEGDVPPDAAHWDAFMDAIVLKEKAIYSSDVTIVEAIGYDAASATSTNPHGDAVYTKTYTTAGTFTPGGTDESLPGDCAALLRYSTPARSSKNHPVYLFNYFHDVYRGSASRDLVSTAQVTAYELYGTEWIAGFSDGTETHERCGPRGAVATSRLCDPHVRHRDFPN
jgi:hypothetical protein